MKPPNAEQAAARGLFALDGEGVHTFSNGTDWECWASGNCLSCRYYDLDGQAGEFCGFEYAAMLHFVSPDLARLFGWTQDQKYADYRGVSDVVSGRHGWNSPDRCAFFAPRTDDNGYDIPIPPDPDPAQLVLLADPTEPFANLQPAVREAVNA